MKWSLYIAKVAGIKIYIHWTFLILLLAVIRINSGDEKNLTDVFYAVLFLFSLFFCVTLHELGHALAAKRYNFKTRDITLLPIGGMARMEGLPERPKHEFVVAIMGPLVSLLIAVLLFAGIKLSGAFQPQLINDLQINSGNFWYLLFTANLFLAGFNLLPAFPMDGGRILRAVLASRLPRLQATRIAARIGQAIAILFVFAGFMGNPMLIFIALFVFLGAEGELLIEENKRSLASARVSDLLMHRYSTLKPQAPLEDAIVLLLNGQERCFIVEDSGKVLGTLSKKDIISGLSKFGKDVPVEKVMRTDVSRLESAELVSSAMQRLPAGAHELVPVYENDRFVGVLDVENISEYISIQNAIKS